MTDSQGQPVDALVIGEALIDIVDTAGAANEYPGGSPANVALTLGRLGKKTALQTVLGDDKRGAAIRSWLQGSSVGVFADAVPRTSTALARIGSDGSAQYDFDLTWTLDQDRAPASTVVHTGSIAATLPPGADSVAERVLRRRDVSTISVDPNVRPSLMEESSHARGKIAELISLADIVKLSDEDLEWLYPRHDARQLAYGWLDRGASIVIVTLGGGGALTFTSSGEIRTPAEKVAVVDTVGAGDTFTGALLSFLLDLGVLGAPQRELLREIPAEPLEAALRYAARAAAITVGRAGANPPWRGELN